MHNGCSVIGRVLVISRSSTETLKRWSFALMAAVKQHPIDCCCWIVISVPSDNSHTHTLALIQHRSKCTCSLPSSKRQWWDNVYFADWHTSGDDGGARWLIETISAMLVLMVLMVLMKVPHADGNRWSGGGNNVKQRFKMRLKTVDLNIAILNKW